MPFIILHICPGTSATWLNVTYTSSQGAQSPRSWTLWPSHLGEPQLILAFLIKALVSMVGPVSWGCHTYIVLHVCTFPSLNSQSICLCAGPWEVLSVCASVL